MRKYTAEVASEECVKAIQVMLDQINFPTTTEAAQTLGCLIMLATRALDALMGPEYAAAAVIKVMECMSTGTPQGNTKIEIINRSKLN
jgi:hypothetical protein